MRKDNPGPHLHLVVIMPLLGLEFGAVSKSSLFFLDHGSFDQHKPVLL